MPVEIAQHGHCHVCGRVVKYGEPTCSDNCKGELERTRKSRKRMMFIMYALFAVIFIFFVFQGVLFGGGG